MKSIMFSCFHIDNTLILQESYILDKFARFFKKYKQKERIDSWFLSDAVHFLSCTKNDLPIFWADMSRRRRLCRKMLMIGCWYA